MKLTIDLHLSFGKDASEDEPQRESDHTGYLADAGTATTGLGFTGVGPKVDQAWEDEG